MQNLVRNSSKIRSSFWKILFWTHCEFWSNLRTDIPLTFFYFLLEMMLESTVGMFLFIFFSKIKFLNFFLIESSNNLKLTDKFNYALIIIPYELWHVILVVKYIKLVTDLKSLPRIRILLWVKDGEILIYRWFC